MELNNNKNIINNNKTEEEKYNDINTSKSKDSFNFCLLSSAKKEKIKLNLNDYYITPSKNNNRKYSIEIITSKLKNNVIYNNNTLSYDQIKFTKKENNSQKFPLFHDKNINLNFKGLNDMINPTENDTRK